MKKKGFTLVELLVVIAIIAMLLAILMPALGKVRQLAYRLMCGTNLGGLGKACAVYSNDYQEQYPVIGKSSCGWQETATTNFTGGLSTWDVDPTTFNTTTGPGLVDKATITSSLYLLIKYADVSPGQFVCKSSTQKKFDLSINFSPAKRTTLTDLTQAFDFGPCSGTTKVWTYCSYSYQMPYGIGTNGTSRFPLSASSQAGLAVMADRNPWFKDDGLFEAINSTPTTSTTGVYVLKSGTDIDATTGALTTTGKTNSKLANSKAHGQEGQNVLYMDSHVAFENSPIVGIEEDNIYAPWATTTGAGVTDKKTGPTAGVTSRTSTTASISQSDTDSFLAN